jgi:3-dehydroquinate synthase
MNYDKAFVLTDTNTIKYCYPAAKEHLSRIDASISDSSVITIGASDVEKNLSSVTHVWEALQKGGATRHSLLVNLGGGMVTDLGGFAASTFKRGIDFINIPTTLLSMVDASVGGKTGFNFGGLKNEIGVFSDPKKVILDTSFLSTLDEENICSGYAEMLKHGLINREGDRM